VINLRDLVANKENLRVKDKEARRRGIPYAANHLVRLLRAMFNLAKDWGMVTGDNPAARIKLFPEHKRDRFLSPDELGRVNRALAHEPNEFWRAYFALSLMLGARKSELLAIRWSDIDFKQRTLRVSGTVEWATDLRSSPQRPLVKPCVQFSRTRLSDCHSSGSIMA